MRSVVSDADENTTENEKVKAIEKVGLQSKTCGIPSQPLRQQRDSQQHVDDSAMNGNDVDCELVQLREKEKVEGGEDVHTREEIEDLRHCEDRVCVGKKTPGSVLVCVHVQIKLYPR